MPLAEGSTRLASAPSLLIVDDEEGAHLTAHLNLSAFRLRHAYNGLQALEAVRAERVDCVLLDLSLPEGLGTQYVRALCARGAEVPQPQGRGTPAVAARKGWQAAAYPKGRRPQMRLAQ